MTTNNEAVRKALESACSATCGYCQYDREITFDIHKQLWYHVMPMSPCSTCDADRTKDEVCVASKIRDLIEENQECGT